MGAVGVIGLYTHDNCQEHEHNAGEEYNNNVKSTWVYMFVYLNNSVSTIIIKGCMPRYNLREKDHDIVLVNKEKTIVVL